MRNESLKEELAQRTERKIVQLKNTLDRRTEETLEQMRPVFEKQVRAELNFSAEQAQTNIDYLEQQLRN